MNQQWQLINEFSDQFGKNFRMAMGIAECPNGDLIIADSVAKLVGIFTSTGIFKVNLTSDNNREGELFTPSDVSVTSEGSIIVVDKSALVKLYDSNTGKFKFAFKTISNEPDQEHIHVCPAAINVHKENEVEYIFILDILRKVLTCHSKDGTYLKSICTGGAPSYFSVISANQFLLSDYSEHVVRLIVNKDASDFKTSFKIDMPRDGLGRRANPVGLCVDRKFDQFYVALGRRQGDCVIQSYDLKTGEYKDCIATNLNNPFNMVITEEDNLVVADKRTVKKYTNVL